jgi:hypothetical protein
MAPNPLDKTRDHFSYLVRPVGCPALAMVPEVELVQILLMSRELLAEGFSRMSRDMCPRPGGVIFKSTEEAPCTFDFVWLFRIIRLIGLKCAKLSPGAK